MVLSFCVGVIVMVNGKPQMRHMRLVTQDGRLLTYEGADNIGLSRGMLESDALNVLGKIGYTRYDLDKDELPVPPGGNKIVVIRLEMNANSSS